MEKLEYRDAIKLLRLKSNAPTQIKVELDAVYGDSTPTFATVKTWSAKFKRDRKSVTDDDSFGRPTTANIGKKFIKLHSKTDESK